MIKMEVLGVQQVLPSNTPVVLLREEGGERLLPIFIGLPEATAIGLALSGQEPPRPMTHDLLSNVLEYLKADLEKIVVAEVKGDVFYARIHLSSDGKSVVVDARPSDAIALALRPRAPILVEEKVIAEAKSLDLKSDEADSERLSKWLESLDPEELGKYKM